VEEEDATVWLDDNDDPNSSILPSNNPSKWLEEFTMEVEEEVEDSCTTEVEEEAIDCMVDADLVTASISSIFSSIRASNCPAFTVEEEDS